MRGRRVAPLCLFLVLLLGGSLAHAEGVTRDSYRAAVEPICARNAEANERILGGVRAEVRRGKLAIAAGKFAKAAAALRSTLTELRRVAMPPADEPRLTRWLGDVRTEASLLQRTGRKLREGRKTAAQLLVVKLVHTAQLANDIVVPFEFRSCRFEPSRYT